MAKADILSVLYSKEKSPLEFQFDSLWLPSLYYYLTPQDVQALYNIASSVRYSSKIELKYKEIDKIMTNRGFKKFHSGTNRVVYSFLEDNSFLAKIAIDKVGLTDNPAEYRNQYLLKPFVTKMFETSPCGTIATVERVEPITSRQEFISVAGDVFEMLNKCILGEYVLEDIGSNYFMNYGLRKGFGVCLLDYPYLFKLDGNKLYCNTPELDGSLCGGVIDYDNGFNNLICTKCGKRYLARELQQSIENKLILLEGDDVKMKVRLVRGNEVVREFDETRETDSIVMPEISQLLNVKVSNVGLSRFENNSPINPNFQNGLPIRSPQMSKPEPRLIHVKQEQAAEVVHQEVKMNARVVSDNTVFDTSSKFIPKADDMPVTNNNNPVETVSNVVEVAKEVYNDALNKIEDVKESLDNKSSELKQEGIAKYGLSDKDFEEDESDVIEKQRQEIRNKYSDLIGDEDDENESRHFQRIKKGTKNKEVMDQY